jgi:hypothetical protein
MTARITIVAVLLAVASYAAGATAVQAAPPAKPKALTGARLAALGRDADRDGISDQRERVLGTSPVRRDTDRDRFPDSFEDAYRELGFDARRRTRDADRDGLADRLERKLRTSRRSPDTDRDGWSDLDELVNRRFGYDPRRRTVDRDFDGLGDSLERRLRTSLQKPDTDGDGLSEFLERRAGLNPKTLNGELHDIVGRTHSDAMDAALGTVRARGRFPHALARELPYPAVTGPLVRRGTVRPSAALMQQSLFSRGLYADYDAIVRALRGIAQRHSSVARVEELPGRTTEGRTLYALKISDNPGANEDESEVLYLGLHHAFELITTSVATGLAKTLTDRYAAGDEAAKRIVDNSEVWIVPVVNPDGYERVLATNRWWRKNLRRVHASQQTHGVDLNRNYGFKHVSHLTRAQRAALGARARSSNGLFASGDFDLDSDTYPAERPFTEVETQAVRSVADDLFTGGRRMTGRKCSLSWHSYGGEVLHPLGHEVNALPADDKRLFDERADAVAAATGYTKWGDRWQTSPGGYPTWGDSEDWLYAAKGSVALTVETYSDAEHAGSGERFFPETAAKRDAVVSANVSGAFALAELCLPEEHRSKARIAFTAIEPPTWEWNRRVYVMDVDGQNQQRLAVGSDPDFSPDGREIAYECPNGFDDVCVMDSRAGESTKRNLTNTMFNEGGPTFSPNGQRIAFVSNRGTNGSEEILVMNADGTGVTRLTDNLDNDLAPSWSPDGTKLVFAGADSDGYDIYVMNADGSGRKQLTTASDWELAPQFSPDGTKIVYHRQKLTDYGPQSDIWMMSANGSGQTQLTSFGATAPTFSPDGRKLAFGSKRSWAGNWPVEIDTLELATGGLTRLTFNGWVMGEPDYSLR